LSALYRIAAEAIGWDGGASYEINKVMTGMRGIHKKNLRIILPSNS
jgi:hypothetical protein